MVWTRMGETYLKRGKTQGKKILRTIILSFPPVTNDAVCPSSPSAWQPMGSSRLTPFWPCNSAPSKRWARQVTLWLLTASMCKSETPHVGDKLLGAVVRTTVDGVSQAA